MISPRSNRCWEWRYRAQFTRTLGVLLITACAIPFPPVAQAQQGPAGTGPASEAGDAALPPLGAVALPPTDVLSDATAADNPSDEDLDAKLDRRGTITMKNANLGDWLFAIRDEWGINIVYSNDAVKNDIVNGEFHNAPLREVLDSILAVRGYGYQRMGNSLMILPESKMGPMKPGFKDAIIRLEYSDPKEVADSVGILLSPSGLVRPMAGAKSIYVADMPARLIKVREHVDTLEANAREVFEQNQLRDDERARDTQGRINDLTGGPESSLELEQEAVNIYRLRFVEVGDILETVQAILGAEGRISVLNNENKLVVMAPSSTLQGVTEVIQRLDVPRPQVRITALLYDVSTEEIERLGFNWSDTARGRINSSGDPQSLFELHSTNFTDGAAAPATTTTDGMADAATDAAVTLPAGGLLRLQHLSRYFDLHTVVQAFSELEGARLLARPNIIAYDGIQASFRSVSEIPVQQLTQTAEGGAIGTTEFREAGILLTVTPRINDDGSLRLTIAPEFSVLAGFQSGQPIIDRRSASTTVHMFDGESVVIGGLLRRNELETQNGVPGLKNLKYLNPLFRFHDTSVGESELIVFVRAEIVPDRGYMSPRDHMAAAVLDEAVERIPVAASHPIIPHCGDPYCPYHSPAPRWIGQGTVIEGESFDPKFEQGVPRSEPLPQSVEPLPSGPIHYEPADQAHRGHPVPAVRVEPERTAASQRIELPGFRVDPPGAPTAGNISQQANRSANVIRRLPHISHETDPRNLLPASAQGPSPSMVRPASPAQPHIRNAVGPSARNGGRRQRSEGRARGAASGRQQPPAASTGQERPSKNFSWIKRFIRFE